jgi:hypothetical protein
MFPAETWFCVLGHLWLHEREKVRRVCQVWNRLAVCLRGFLEVSSYPVASDMVHLGVSVRDIRYLKWVTCQEDFDTLWVEWLRSSQQSRRLCGNINPLFVTLEIAKMVIEDANSYFYTARYHGLIRWRIRLRYEVMVGLPRQNASWSHDRTAANEIIAQSRAGTLDPRKVPFLVSSCRVDLLTHVLSHCDIPAAWNSTLMRAAVVCPEVAVLYRITHDLRLEPRDSILSLDPRLFRFLGEPRRFTGDDCTPEGFAAIYREIFRI